jgi:hypothetical protein
MKVRRESVQTRSETSTRRREALKHARAVCRGAERRNSPSQPRIRACSRSFMNNAGSSGVRRPRNRVVVHMMIYAVSATRADAFSSKMGETTEGSRSEVQGFRNFEPRTSKSVSRAPDVLHPSSLRGPCAKNVVYQLYIQILAQYNSGVLQHVVVRDTFALTA